MMARRDIHDARDAPAVDDLVQEGLARVIAVRGRLDD
jgi:hypothetical protein